MIAAGLIPMGVASIIISEQAGDSFEQTTFNRLQADVSIRNSFVSNYFETIKNQVIALSNDTASVNAMKSFSSSFSILPLDFSGSTKQGGEDIDSIRKKLGRYYEGNFIPTLEGNGDTTTDAQDILPQSDAGIAAQHYFLANNANPVGSKDRLVTLDTSNAYSNTHSIFHESFNEFLDLFSYYDIFLVEPERGDIVYSVYKEVDFGTSVFTGPYSDTGLAEVVREAMTMRPNEYVISDFGNYLPSYGAAAAFVASPIFDDEKLIGVMAFQISVDTLSNIMTLSDGLGESGESLLVGRDNLLRSQSRLNEEPTILRTSLNANAVSKAFEGEEGVATESDGEGNYLYAYAPLEVEGLDWAIVSRMKNDEALAAVSALRNTELWVAGISIILVTLCSILLGQFFYRQLGGDPRDMMRIATEIGQGNLADAPGDENSKGAYGELVKMRGLLRSILHDAVSIAGSVNAGARELSDANVGLSDRTDQQAANLEETGSSTEELTSTVKQNAENAKAADKLAKSTQSRALSSGDVSSNAITAMEDISAASEKIADIISVIDEIAFQTNLLALNAAVEAARAGEQGRGFAVVASEVRQLAGRSASAAREIKDLIEDSVTKVKDGTQLVTESGQELRLIVDSVSELTDLVGQISIATDEQAVGIEQINHALVHMDSVTQQNAAMVQEAATTSKKMSCEAEQLSGYISYFSADGVKRDAEAAEEYLRSLINLDCSAALTSSSNVTPLRQSPKANNAPDYGEAANSPELQPAPVKRASGSDEMWDEF